MILRKIFGLGDFCPYSKLFPLKQCKYFSIGSFANCYWRVFVCRRRRLCTAYACATLARTALRRKRLEARPFRAKAIKFTRRIFQMRRTKFQRITALALALVFVLCAGVSVSGADASSKTSQISEIKELLNSVSYTQGLANGCPPRAIVR